MQRSSRLKKEITQLLKNPSDGISCYPNDDDMTSFTANIIGPRGTPYDGGVFELEVKIPERYPFEPPKIRFITPVYHPNIDSGGRICMDLLKMPPKGGWKPTINLENLLSAVRLLLGNPNPDDPLEVEIAEEYRSNKSEFERKARKLTLEAMEKKSI